MGKIYSHDQVQSRIDGIVIASGGSGGPTYSETLTSPKYMVSTIIGCTLSLMQQLSGINIVMFYSSKILDSLQMKATLITAMVGIVNCVSVFPTIILFKKFGRKVLLWTLSLAIAASLIGLGVCLIVDAQWHDNYGKDNAVCQALSIVFLMLFIIFFEFSLGPLLWVYMSEIMTEKGLSLGVVVNQVATILIALFTPTLINAFGKGNLGSGRLFVTCGGITAGTALFVLFVVKETKGLTEQEVANLYSREPDVKIERQSLLQLDNTR